MKSAAGPNHLWWWILATAFGTFAAGMSVGLAIPRMEAAMRDRSSSLDAEEAYVRALTGKYGLSAAQQRSVGLVLLNGRSEELAVLDAADPSQLPAAVQNSLLAVRSRTEQRIRAVLSDEQCARYDLDSRPQGPLEGVK